MFDIPQGSVTESCSKKGPIYTQKQYAQQVMCARVFGLRNMLDCMLSTRDGGTEGGGERNGNEERLDRRAGRCLVLQGLHVTWRHPHQTNGWLQNPCSDAKRFSSIIRRPRANPQR